MGHNRFKAMALFLFHITIYHTNYTVKPDYIELYICSKKTFLRPPELGGTSRSSKNMYQLSELITLSNRRDTKENIDQANSM